MHAYLSPDLARPGLLERPQNGKRFMEFETAGVASIKFRGIDIAMLLDVTNLTDNGIVICDPAIVPAEAGRRLADHIVETTAALIAEFCDAPQQET